MFDWFAQLVTSANVIERLNELPAFLSNHMLIAIVALGVGVTISVPTAIVLTRFKSLRYPTLTVAGVIQTIPSLALLALMVPVLVAVSPLLNDAVNLVFNGAVTANVAEDDRIELFRAFGFWPAIIALTLYSILPILRNTVTGILGVDPRLTEAARGIGMTSLQSLFQVELPLAAPVIIAGIRTATVWVVGIATLATPVGQTCLGNYIFQGLQTQNWLMVVFGVVAAAALAIVLDGLIGMLQRASENRSLKLGLSAGSCLALLIAASLIWPMFAQGGWLDVNQQQTDGDDGQPLPNIVVGTKTFTEQYILGQLIEQTLADQGFAVSRKDSLGSTQVFQALVNGEIDVYVDYSGTIWANHMKRDNAAPPSAVLSQVSAYLQTEHRITCLGTLGFQNAYALVVRNADANELGIESIADLKQHAPDWEIGGDYEFFGRPEWTGIRDTYDLDFKKITSFDSSIMYQAIAQKQIDVLSAFSSDGRIAAYDLKVLKDPKYVIPPYDAIVLIGPNLHDNAGKVDSRVVDALLPLIEAISLETMQQANYRVDRDNDRLTPGQAADWLAEQISIGE